MGHYLEARLHITKAGKPCIRIASPRGSNYSAPLTEESEVDKMLADLDGSPLGREMVAALAEYHQVDVDPDTPSKATSLAAEVAALKAAIARLAGGESESESESMTAAEAIKAQCRAEGVAYADYLSGAISAPKRNAIDAKAMRRQLQS